VNTYLCRIDVLITIKVVEPSGAVPFAVTLTDEFRSLGFKKVGIVLSGGNVDLDEWKW
jgi:threonine dehydratase